MSYQVCTCSQSSLTSGDPNCPIHGIPMESVTYSYCGSCTEKDAEIKELKIRIIKLKAKIAHQAKGQFKHQKGFAAIRRDNKNLRASLKEKDNQ